LVVTDDGRGIVDEERRRRLDEGHIGLYSQTVRVEAGGALTVVGSASGTTGTVVLPVEAKQPGG
jgi:signal transduction histidine kinase